MHSKNFLLLVLFIFSCCSNEEAPSPQKEKWTLTKYLAHTTSCCYAFDENGTLTENGQSHPIFNKLLALDDEGFFETTLSLIDGHSFEILKDDRTVLQGSMERDHQRLQLNYYSHSLHLKVLRMTTDSLVIEAKGYECGITNVTMTFYRRRE